ncbi:MAG: hypothetical protein AMXMBFR47_03610 [Planctomycetota bacterium]
MIEVTWPLRILASLALVVSLSAGGCPVDGDSGAGDSLVPPSTETRPLIRDDDHIKSVGAPAVTVIEYGDFQCPVCARFFSETYPTILSEYVETGKVRWVYRHFPLRAVHPDAEAASQATECAGDEAFWDFHDTLYANQDDLSRDALVEYATARGLDADAFTACLDRGDSAARVQTDVDSGITLGVSGTPTFFVNGTRVAGFRTVEQFREILDQALAEAQ